MKYIHLSVTKPGKRNLKRVISWTAVVLYMLVIFLFSNQQGAESNRLSGSIVKEVRSHVNLPAEIKQNDKTYKIDYNRIIRKTTHFFQYFLLALLFYLAFASCDLNTKSCIIISFILSVFYAGLDEFHQWFVFERSSRLMDIIIDSSGALLSLSLVYIRKRSKLDYYKKA